MPTNENHNNVIEKSLAQLLRQLKEAKIRQSNWGRSNSESLNEGMKALENIQFASVDDFQSVKELIEVEQFFSRSDILNHFYFPVYKPLIHPTLLAYVLIEVQLDTLEMKSLNLAYRGHRLAAGEAKNVVVEVRNLNLWYFSEQKIDYNDYKTRALKLINESRSILEKHRGYKKILGNLLILIVTLGTGLLIHKASTGRFLFFRQTDSTKHLDELAQIVDISSPINSLSP